MDRSKHTMACLFSQLGIENDEKSIELFIKENRELIDNEPLANAKFWSKNQANFINEAITTDSDWCEIVDTLDALLR